MTIAGYSIGSMIGSEIFLPQDAPHYTSGKVAMLVLFCTSLVLCLLIRTVNLKLMTEKRNAVERLKSDNGWSDIDLERERQRHAFLDMTDKECVLP
jgi:MFS transporter, ACS family, allantoate permease